MTGHPVSIDGTVLETTMSRKDWIFLQSLFYGTNPKNAFRKRRLKGIKSDRFW